MRIDIIISESTGDKELFLNDDFYGSWNDTVDDMEVIIPYALDKAREIGEKKKQKEIKTVLGL